VLKDLEFNTGKYIILPQYYHELDGAIVVLKNNPNVDIEIQGHTDSVGQPKDNMILSDNRAKAVKDYFIAHGISKDRLFTKGYGATRPIAPNNTVEGRTTNRRVELSVMK